MTLFATENDSYAPIRLREGEYERLVPRFVEQISRRWRWADWKPLLEGPGGRVRPDVALLARDLSGWCVVEIELAQHPESHYRPQLQALEQAYYGTHLLPSLAYAFPGTPETELRRLLRDEPPTLLCIADDLTESLRVTCREFGFELAVGTPYRSQWGNYAVEWRRIPPCLVEYTASSVEYRLHLTEERLGGRRRATLPRDFPRIRQFTMRAQDTLYPMRVFVLGDSRATFLPVGVSPAAERLLLLRPIDPATALYELVNGEVIE